MISAIPFYQVPLKEHCPDCKAFQEKASHLYTILIFLHPLPDWFPDSLLTDHKDPDSR